MRVTTVDSNEDITGCWTLSHTLSETISRVILVSLRIHLETGAHGPCLEGTAVQLHEELQCSGREEWTWTPRFSFRVQGSIFKPHSTSYSCTSLLLAD